MPTTYAALLDGNENLSAARYGDHQPFENSRGRRFLRHCEDQGLDPAQNLVTVAEAWHDFLANEGWTWNTDFPCETYNYGARLLDGTAGRGDCGYPAYGLALLLNAPDPWGFGLGNATVARYDGQNHDGFIAAHLTPLPGLAANVTRPNGTLLQGFYLWDNHKVVAHGGHFYDVSYRQHRNALAGLAPASLRVVRENVRLRDLENYNPKSLWGFTLGWGLPRLAMLKLSDVASNNSHTITVFQATNVTNGALNGWYIQWEESWGWRGNGFRPSYYGPYTRSPLVR
jgi:hypothetical protein